MRRVIAPLVLVVVSILLAPPAAFAQYEVHDEMNIQEATDIQADTSKQVTRLGQVYDTVQSVLDAICAQGTQDGLDSLLSLSQNLNGLAPRLPSVNGNTFPAQGPRTVSALRDFAGTTFYTSTTDPTNNATARIQARQQAVREAAVNGYAVAIEARDDSAAMPQRMSAVAKSAQAAKCLRQDILAGNAALLMMLERMNQMQATLASILEIESAGRIGADSAGTYAPSN